MTPSVENLAIGNELPLGQALDWGRAWYAEYAQAGYVRSQEMPPAREKMTLLPQGATPLRNEWGAAPGVLPRSKSTVLVSLPGVPGEMRAIYDGPLQETLAELLGAGVTIERRAHVASGDESVLAPLLRDVSKQHPCVYIISRARAFGDERRVLVTLSARGGTEGLSGVSTGRGPGRPGIGSATEGHRHSGSRRWGAKSQ